uniref:Nuclear factor kappa B subunit 2 n=1 Tax=Leptobrachium leishanense TaxID=445787 RepID=A0A8C5R8E9_9ANUR
MTSIKMERFDTYMCPKVNEENGYMYPDIMHGVNLDLEMPNGPYIDIIEQPKQRGFRFRYVCEGPSHGGLPGATSEKGKKTYPTVKIFNYVGLAKIEVDLVTHTDPPRVHAHSLVGKAANEDGIYVTDVGPKDMTAQFNNLGIVHVTKKSQIEILKEKMRQQIIRNRMGKGTVTEPEEKKIEQEVKELKKVTDLSIVRLRFTAYLPDSTGAYTLPLKPVISNPIHDSKSPGASNLRISRMDKTAGSVKGGDEVYLLCDKVQKDDIEVRFYEDDENSWEDLGVFAPTDVHKQYAIVFRTPPYRQQKIDRPVTVFLQLRRRRGGDVSDSKQFTYYPVEQDKEEVERKRRKEIPTFNHYHGGGAPLGGAGGGTGGFGQGGVFGNNNMNFQYSGMNPGFYPTTNYGGGYMKEGSTTPNTAENTEHTVTVKKEDGEPSSGSSPNSSEAAQRDAQYSNMIRQVRLSHVKMLSFAERMSKAFMDYAVTADPLMLLAVHRHLISTQDENGDTPLHLAIIHGQTSVIQELVKVILSIPNQQILNISNNLHQTPLHLSVITRQSNIVPTLLAAGADPTMLDRYGNSVLHLAVQAGDEVMLRVLLGHPSVSRTNLLETPDYQGLYAVHWAVKGKNEKCLQLLVKHGANVNVMERKSGRSPLHVAVEMDNLNMATFLVKKLNADVNARTYGGNTPLHLAASLGSPVLTKMLISAGANVLMENDEPVNVPMSHARYESDSDCDVQMETDSDHQEDSDSGSSSAMDSDCEEMDVSTPCATKRPRPGHTPYDLTKSEKVKEILSKHISGSVPCKTKDPESGNILCLQTSTVQRLEKLLNEGHTGADWAELASRLNLQSLVETYKNTSSPTENLLRSYELAGGNLGRLVQTLESMGLNEGVQLLRTSDIFNKQEYPEMKVDSAYDSQTIDEECSTELSTDDLSKPMHEGTINMSPDLASGTKPARGL